jgi:acetyl esterase/lipase
MATGFFTYLRLKVFAVVMRLGVSIFNLGIFQNAQNHQQQRLNIPSRDGAGRHIRADLYLPDTNTDSTASLPTPMPVLINWHGSGFVIPMLGSDAEYCAYISRTTGMAVLDADYRKAPENPFPAALHDVEDVIRWVASQPERFDRQRIALSGFSAGGNLALVASSSSSSVRSLPIDIKAVVAFYPPTDLSIAPEAKRAPDPRSRPIPAAVARFFNRCYIPDSASRKDPRISPAYADKDGFPGTVVIITCDGDNLAPEGDALATKLDDGRHRVVHVPLKGVGHAYDKGGKEGSVERKRRNESYGLVADVLREVLNK